MTQCTIFITGGAGFIGSHFAQYILDTVIDARVVIFDKLTYAGSIENIPSHSEDRRLSFVEGDICDARAVREAMRGCNCVVNFAAETHVDRSIIEPDIFVHTDIGGTLTLLNVAKELEIERFIQISTDEVYGNAEAPDGRSRPSLETDALKPLSPYAAAKTAADRLAFSYWATYGLPIIITRCSNNYGSRQYPEKQLPLFIINALAGRSLPVYGGGGNTRDWIYVTDHCAALKTILFGPSEQVIGEVLNIGTNDERSILDNARSVLHFLGLPDSLISYVPDRLGHVKRHAVNSKKLRERLGWVPKIKFEEGLVQTILWYRDHEKWLENIITRRDSFLEDALTRHSNTHS